MSIDQSGFAKIARAKRLAESTHLGQKRFDGSPYITHVKGVATQVSLIPDVTWEMICAAWLHDVVEDHNVSVDKIEQYFGLRVRELVVALTRDEGETYEAFIDRIVDDEQAAQIKICDITNNLSTLPLPSSENYKRNLSSRYIKALARLYAV